MVGGAEEQFAQYQIQFDVQLSKVLVEWIVKCIRRFCSTIELLFWACSRARTTGYCNFENRTIKSFFYCIILCNVEKGGVDADQGWVLRIARNLSILLAINIILSDICVHNYCALLENVTSWALFSLHYNAVTNHHPYILYLYVRNRQHSDHGSHGLKCKNYCRQYSP